MSAQTQQKDLITSTRTAVKVTYDAFSPAQESALRIIQKPLPFQSKATENLEWATAFIDHSGHLIKAQEHSFDELSKKHNAALNTIGQNETKIESLKSTNAALETKVSRLQSEVIRRAKAYQALDEAFDKYRERAKAEKLDLTNKLNSTRKELNAARSNVKSLVAKLIKADKDAHAAWEKERLGDVEDHKALEDLREALEKETKTNAELQAKLEQKTKQLTATEQKLQESIDGRAQSDKEIFGLKETIEQLKKQISAKDRQIARLEVELKNAKQENDSLSTKVTKLSDDNQKKAKDLASALQEVVEARTKIAELEVEITGRNLAIDLLSEQLTLQREDSARTYDELRSRSEETIKELLAKIGQLEEHNAQDDKNLADLTEAGKALAEELAKARADDESDKNIIKKLTGLQTHLEQEIGRLTGEKFSGVLALQELNEKLKALQASLNATVAEQKQSQEKSTQLIEDLQGKIQKVTGDDEQDKATISALKEATEASNKAIQDMKAQADLAKKQAEDAQKQAELAQKQTEDEKAKAKAAEEAAKKAADELAEAKKPKLDNDVKLANPIALVGSLRGAPRNVDDETFSINCPFPVTLFNATSSKIYISVNGLFTLERPSTIFDHQKLPYNPYPWAEKLPDFVLAPFWADLYIYKNTPQGVYYEVTGEAPNRKLEVEWYVSRYNSPKDYYHFTLAVEEAKPNHATFKFFEALDKGAKCTVGIQGRKIGRVFSYNQEKVLPGTKLVFDTAANTYHESTFPITKAPVKAPVAKDIKSSTVVTATVEEVSVGQ